MPETPSWGATDEKPGAATDFLLLLRSVTFRFVSFLSVYFVSNKRIGEPNLKITASFKFELHFNLAQKLNFV
ncbi:MAG: hypothetical protein COT74_07855 [Bdellovibrionales bacterium CG10_big_fil_rev_8_21_14_0_10_45_34]|nr:MAG: hypothetical protein COT74_07855 [Bdellovibrionales bacterium CG10_big_fil_rev_8_21_14_0_10_45_34]